jgi:integrase
VREEIISRNVAMLVQVPGTSKENDDDTSALTPEQAKRLLESVRTHRLYALFVLTLLLGLRRSEALGLRWDDTDLAAGTLHVRRGLHRVGGELTFLPTKTRRSRRTVPLPHLCVQALTDHAQRQAAERRAARH